jgi:hypothetical protein
MNGGANILFVRESEVMIDGLSGNIEFEQVFHEDRVNYEGEWLALDQSQFAICLSGRVTRKTYTKFGSRMESHFLLFGHHFFVFIP